MSEQLRNINIASVERIPAPAELAARLPLTPAAERTVLEGRRAIGAILDGSDPRLFGVVGPCSVHDPAQALDYAERLARLRERIGSVCLPVMRVYFEKPRTSIGWKGFINDPHLDGSFRIDEGLRLARSLLLELAERGLPAATEVLEPFTPQYIGDLVAWSAIGARTVESQVHRQLASGLSTPVGFKNGTGGDVDAAVSAVLAASQPHHFHGVRDDGGMAVFGTRGNRRTHVVLRGGDRPNYEAASVADCEEKLRAAGLPAVVAIDCSHGNSRKAPERQLDVLNSAVEQIERGNRSIVGFMLEGHLHGGRQDVGSGAGLRYGVSITDACLDWPSTEEALLRAAERLAAPLRRRAAEKEAAT